MPFPKPLDRSAFLSPDFTASSFLSSLNNRFQTLEDLQSELQDLLKGLNKDLVDLVNDNYTDFLSLGDRLRGGEERIEEIRVGLLGFQRDVTGVRDMVSQRSNDIKELLEAKMALRREMRVGRMLLEIDERLEDLEDRTGIKSTKVGEQTGVEEHDGDDDDLVDGGFKDWDESWTKDEDGELEVEDSDEDAEISEKDRELPRRLRTSLEALQSVQALAKRCGETHPFLLAQRDRFAVIRDVLRKDLEAEIRNQPVLQVKQRLIKLRTELEDD